MAEFHNPYHFVPVKRGSRSDDLAPEILRGAQNKSTQVTHRNYMDGTFSGRLVCRLTTEDPVFIGNKSHGEDLPKKVMPFEINGSPAIPASTLRGLVSSLAEAASNSAMRVLYDQSYSYRREMKEALSAIGMVVVTKDNTGETRYELRPLTLPVLIKENDNKNFKLPIEYEGIFAEPNLKVYLNSVNVPRSVRAARKHEFYYLKVTARSWTKGSRLPSTESSLYTKGRYLLAQKASGPATPISRDEWDKIPLEEQPSYVRGVVRALDDGEAERKKHFPRGRHYELFIPYPESAEKWKTLPIPQEVVDRFHDLADQRVDDHKTDDDPVLPFHPLGTVRNESPKGKHDLRFRLKNGDLVYFRPTGDKKAIAEVALSSIWRGRVDISHEATAKKASTHTFFAEVDKNLLPFNKDREVITIAEQIFGFVQQDRKDDEEGSQREREGTHELALAGRTRFSHAILEGFRGSESPLRSEDQPYMGETILKILASPKPPSPAMYFKMKNGENDHIRKRALNPHDHQPQGRKFYLHHRGTTNEPWRTTLTGEDLRKVRKQVVSIRPLKPNAVFYFHIDFDNLTGRELGLLLYALQPFGKNAEPLENFHHKIGMGKPIGLGKAKIEPIGMFLVDRRRRYSVEGYESSRYSAFSVSVSAKVEEWPAQNYEREKVAAVEAQATVDIKAIRQKFADVLDDDIHRAIELIGDPTYLQAEVHTPTARNQPNKEKETFKWFVENDKPTNGRKQFLHPISSTTEGIEPLEEL